MGFEDLFPLVGPRWDRKQPRLLGKLHDVPYDISNVFPHNFSCVESERSVLREMLAEARIGARTSVVWQRQRSRGAKSAGHGPASRANQYSVARMQGSNHKSASGGVLETH